MKNSFAKRLRTYRDYMCETREELGKAIGATVSAIRTWEDGRHNCSFDDLLRIAEHYDITTDYLLGFTPDDEPANAKRKQDPLSSEDRRTVNKFEEYLINKTRQKK